MCDKVLPVEYASSLCSLCRVGLTPSTATGWNIGRGEPPMVIQGRELSGIPCPMCNAELTQADLDHLSCALCSEEFTPERMRILRNQAITRKSRIAMDLLRQVNKRR